MPIDVEALQTLPEDEFYEWLACVPWLGGEHFKRCPVCQAEIRTPNDIKASRFGRGAEQDIVHKTCWSTYEATQEWSTVGTVPRLRG